MADAALQSQGQQFLAPPTDRAAIYVFRDANAGSVPFAMSLDQRQLGTLGRMNWLRIDVKPGRYDLRCFTVDLGAASDSLQLVLAAGDIRYVQANYKTFRDPHCLLAAAPPTAAQPIIRSTARIREVGGASD